MTSSVWITENDCFQRSQLSSLKIKHVTTPTVLPSFIVTTWKTQEWIAPLFFNRLSEKQKHTVFYCPFTAHKAPGVGFCPSEAFHGQVHISPAPRSVGAQRRREDPRPPCVKGKAYQLHGWPHLSGMRQGHGTKVASFLCKGSTTCPENCCLTLKWLSAAQSTRNSSHL